MKYLKDRWTKSGPFEKLVGISPNMQYLNDVKVADSQHEHKRDPGAILTNGNSNSFHEVY